MPVPSRNRSVTVAALITLALAFAGCRAPEPEPSPATGRDTEPLADAGTATADRWAAEPPEAPVGPIVSPPEVAPPSAEDELARWEEDLADREAEVRAREKQVADREARLAQQWAAEERARREQPAPVPQPETAPLPVQETTAPPIEEAPPAEPVRETVLVTVPAGTGLDIEFVEGLSSATSSPGDRFRTRVAHDVLVEGTVAIPAESEILGTVTEAVSAKKIGGRSRLALRFDRLELPSGEGMSIDVTLNETGKSQTKKDAATIGGATAGGAILGGVLDKGKGSVLGAVVGAAVGTAIAAKNKGEEVTIEPGTILGIQLAEWLRVTVER